MTIVYQTLKDKFNPEHVELYGPFKCTNAANAWLGEGYYFWDTHIELAQWWGKVSCNNEYIICKATCVIDEDCWDLHGNGDHRLEFTSILNLCAKGVKGHDPKVGDVIEFLKQKGKFKYKAIRILGTNSSSINRRVLFTSKNTMAYFDLIPPIQICLIEKTALGLHRYKIVYPESYVDEGFA